MPRRAAREAESRADADCESTLQKRDDMSKKMRRCEPVVRTSADLMDESMARLREIFPECFTEGRVDFDKLRATLGEEVDSRPERYSFSWAGKRDALRLLQTPSRATLIPCPKESVNFDKTNNLFIEGDNLEVLKLLYKSYFGRVKMIYIDPPYNTGNDFIYPDNFADPLDTYLHFTGQKGDDGNLLTSNPETSGRYHSAWLSMMYPRLFLARQLLCEDGVIFVSIDDHEVYNLRLLMNKVFGEDNFVAQLVWEKGRKNDAKLVSVGHEYIFVYLRNKSCMTETRIMWREAKPGADEIHTEYLRLRQEHGKDNEAVERGIRAFYARLPKTHPSKKHSRYGRVDDNGVWRDHDMSWPGGGGPTYDVIHPVTGKPCAVPEGGWRYSTLDKMNEMIGNGKVVFREDHTQPPIRKTYLVRGNNDEEAEEIEADDIGIQVAGSYFYRSAIQASNELIKLFGGKIFENPKDHEVLARWISYVGSPQKDDIVLDFFSGSGTTAQAVVALNHEDGGNRRFICVQLPEPTPEGSEARKQGYKTIADIGKERIRRVIQKMKKDSASKLDLKTRDTPEDLGFKVFKLAESNYKPWAGVEEKDSDEYAKTMELYTDSLVPGWKPTNVMWEVIVKEGYGLHSRIKRIAETKGNTVYRVTDPDKGQSFRICLDDRLKAATLKALNLGKDELFICRDKALDDQAAVNLALQCRLKTI